MSPSPVLFPRILRWTFSLTNSMAAVGPKSASYWRPEDLATWKIELETVSKRQFFGVTRLPIPKISHTILNNLNQPRKLTRKVELDFFQYLDDAMCTIPLAEESTVDDFAAFLLKMLKYDEGNRVVHSRKEMGFIMCETRVYAKANICVMDRLKDGLKFILLIQENKRHLSTENPEPQLIAEAIAAFHENNKILEARGLPKVKLTIVPGIIMKGTYPRFYKIPVTDKLTTALARGQNPVKRTVVERFEPPVSVAGMKPLEDRKVCLQCFEAFRRFVTETPWKKALAKKAPSKKALSKKKSMK